MSERSAYLEKIVDMLAQCSMLSTFSPTELQRAAHYFNLSETPKCGVIFREGDVGNFMGIIHSGCVSVMKNDSEDRPVGIAMLKKDKTFGEMAVLDGERRSATCVAETSCNVVTLSRDALDRMLREHPLMGAKMIRAIAVALSRRLRVADFKVAEHHL